MRVFTSQFFRGQVGAAPHRVFETIGRQPSWALRLALGAAAVTVVAVILLLVVPAVVIGTVVLLLAGVIARLKAAFSGLRRPNGALDGRRNVRVIIRPAEHAQSEQA